MTAKTLDQHIESTRGIMGGQPRIAGHRITVQDIDVWHKLLGYSVEEIAADYNLDLADIHAALAYYYDHREEIDAEIDEEDAFVAALRQVTPSKLARKLHELQS